MYREFIVDNLISLRHPVDVLYALHNVAYRIDSYQLYQIERWNLIQVVGRLTNDFYVHQRRDGILIPIYP